MYKRKYTSSPVYKVRSKINRDVYFTSKDFPNKIIDGKEFIGVKKNEHDHEIFFMVKENLEYVNEGRL